MFEVMPDAFTLPDAPNGNADLKASMLKWPGFFTHNFAVLCMADQEELRLQRLAAAGVGYMNFAQQVEPRRHDPLSTGFASGVESLVVGEPTVMLFSNSYQNEDRDLGNDPRAWLRLVQDRIRTKKESGVRSLLGMDTTTMLLPQYAEAWTLAGVLAKQPEKFGKLIVALRDEKDPLKAVEQIYGWDEKKLEDQWHKEVLGGPTQPGSNVCDPPPDETGTRSPMESGIHGLAPCHPSPAQWPQIRLPEARGR